MKIETSKLFVCVLRYFFDCVHVQAGMHVLSFVHEIQHIFLYAYGNHFLWQNLDPNNLSDEGHKSTLLWSFEILPAPAAEFVKPSMVKLRNLRSTSTFAESWCNCASPSPSPYCLVPMIANAAENVISITSEQETNSPAVSSEDECSAGKVYTKEYFTDTFPLKGSFWEGRYQESLIKCVKHKQRGKMLE